MMFAHLLGILKSFKSCQKILNNLVSLIQRNSLFCYSEIVKMSIYMYPHTEQSMSGVFLRLNQTLDFFL